MEGIETGKKTTVESELVRNRPSLMRYALYLTKDPTDAQDLFQETAYRILANDESFSFGTDFRAWSTTVMYRLFLNHTDKIKRHRSFQKQGLVEKKFYNGRPYAVNRGEWAVFQSEVKAKLMELGENIWLPMTMFYEGYRYDEISDYMDESHSAVKSRIFTGRRKMRKGYDEMLPLS